MLRFIQNSSLIAFLALLLGASNNGFAQCSGGTSGGALSPTPGTSFQTMSVSAGTYYTFSANCGDVFTFSFCQGGGQHGTINTEDTQLTILDNSGAYANGYNDDDATCSCSCGNGSEVIWTASTSGTYRVLVNKYNCVSTAFLTFPVKLAYKYVAATTPSSSPGGVYCSLTSWLKADNSTSLTLSSGNVSNWTSSYGSVSVSQATSSKRPALTAGSASYTSFSYMPYIQFNSSASTALNNSSLATDILGSTGTMILVSDRDQSTTGTLITFETSSAIYKYQVKPKFRIQSSANGSTGYAFNFTSPSGFPSTSASEITNVATGGSEQIKLNSVLTSVCSQCNNSTYLPSISSGIYLGNNNGSENSSNRLAEIITYNRTLTSAELDLVESYISIKYGIMRGSNSSPIDYYSSASSTVWSTASNSGYTNDVAAIGRDDASGLNKKQSISVNTDEAVTIGLNVIASDNASNTNVFASDKSFLLWGNNGGTLIGNNTLNLPSCAASRLNRVWKTQPTNFSQNVTVGFETSQLTNYTPLTNLVLLLDDDGNFSNATCVTGATLNGTRVEFAGINLYGASNRYFTLGTINDAATSLPIELLSFSAKCAAAGNLITWSTAQEHNVVRIALEKSTDAIAFNEIYSTAGHLNKSTVTNYSFTDREGNSSVSYRLVEYDLNGSRTNFNAVPIENDCAGADLLLFPNPTVDGRFNIRLGSSDNSLVSIIIYTVLGQTTAIYSYPTSPTGIQQCVLDLSDKADGTYFIQINTENKIYTKIITKNRHE
jgi:hypothetical protein